MFSERTSSHDKRILPCRVLVLCKEISWTDGTRAGRRRRVGIDAGWTVKRCGYITSSASSILASNIGTMRQEAGSTMKT